MKYLVFAFIAINIIFGSIYYVGEQYVEKAPIVENKEEEILKAIEVNYDPKKADKVYTGEYKIGKPYSISGKTYYPQFDKHYNKVGLASWYGPGFHGRKTANGEIFNKWAMTAAHPTLPMLSKVKVTNLDNGKEVFLIINDRGPFHGNRIIDVSKAAAIKLGFINKGTAKVRVEYHHKKTESLLKERGLYTQYVAKTQ